MHVMAVSTTRDSTAFWDALKKAYGRLPGGATWTLAVASTDGTRAVNVIVHDFGRGRPGLLRGPRLLPTPRRSTSRPTPPTRSAWPRSKWPPPPPPVAARLQVVDHRALEHGVARQPVERRGQAAERRTAAPRRRRPALRLLVGLQLELPLEPDDVGVLGQVFQQLRVEQPRAAGERRVVLVGEVTREERAGLVERGVDRRRGQRPRLGDVQVEGGAAAVVLQAAQLVDGAAGVQRQPGLHDRPALAVHPPVDREVAAQVGEARPRHARRGRRGRGGRPVATSTRAR